MANALLSKGISILYDMEINNYLMTRSINQLNRQISKLGIHQKFKLPKKDENDVSIADSLVGGLMIGAIAGAIFGVIFGFCTGNGFFGKIGSAFAGLIGYGLAIAACGGVLGLIVGIIWKVLAAKAIEEKYNSDLAEYKKNLSNDELRVKNELRQKQILVRQRDSLISRRQEATNKLSGFYNTIGIDRSYRSLVPIGYMTEFMRLGISNKLEGTDGLYYLIRQELRMDQFQYTLDEISNKLDMLIDRQRELYRELVSINSRCEDLVRLTVQESKNTRKSLDEISNNTRIAAYNSERAAQELSYQNFMLTYHTL